MKGFQNIGNTCYLNAAMQLLFQNQDFIKMILEYDNSLLQSKDLSVIQEQIKEYYDGTGKVMNIIKIKQLIENDKEANYLFRGYNQHDSSEFVIQFLDYVDTILKKDNMSVDNIFNINIKSRIKCKKIDCLTISETKQNNNFLLLDVIDEAKDLDDLYRNYKSSEKLNGDNMYYCDKCKSKTVACKRYEITEWPNNLLVWIKRFTNNNGRLLKNNTNINCPIKWRHNMKLMGCIIHAGSMGGGHYIYIGNNNGKWHIYDDNTISEISEEKALKYITSGYMLYYKKESDIVNN